MPRGEYDTMQLGVTSLMFHGDNVVHKILRTSCRDLRNAGCFLHTSDSRRTRRDPRRDSPATTGPKSLG